MKMDTWASIRHLFFVEQLPKKAIARKLGLDPKTIRRALKKETFSAACPPRRSSKLDPFKEKILANISRIEAGQRMVDENGFGGRVLPVLGFGSI